MNNQKTDRVAIFDTTLRDGEQAAGTRLGAREKLIIARQLAKLGVDIIEAGYPASSPEDFESVQRIAREIDGPVICALSRAVPSDVEACGKALQHCRRSRIHTGIGASDLHIAGKFRDARYGQSLPEKRATVLRMAADAVTCATQFTDQVEFYAEDAGRADPAFLHELLAAAIEAGAGILNIPDTTGYTVPAQYGALIRQIRKEVPGIAGVTISVHCHDDLGMAVANTLAGVINGARQVEATINGLGERAGNASLEEIVMAIRTRFDYYGLTIGVNSQELWRTSRLVADLFNIPVPPNKAIVGDNAFAHSSGIHVDGFLKQRETYEIIHPELVGAQQSRVVLTARTGRHGLHDRFCKLGYTLSQDELDQAYQRFLAIADKKQEIFDEDLVAILLDEVHTAPELYRLEYLQVCCGTSAIPTATVRIKVQDQTREGASTGDGPIDAICKAIASVTGTSAKMARYEIKAVTAGTAAIGEVTIQLEDKGYRVLGRAASTDVVEASARAYLDGLNNLTRVSRTRVADA